MKKLLCMVIFLLITSHFLHAQGWEPEIVFNNTTTLSDSQKVEFGKQAIQMVNQLGYYIKTILELKNKTALQDSAIINARKLFVNPNQNIIQIMVRKNMSIKDAELKDFDGDNPEASRRAVRALLANGKNVIIEYSPVGEYFKELKYIANNGIYHKVQINSSDAVLSKDLVQGVDGNYYGTASFCRIFEGIVKKGEKKYRDKGRNCYQVDIVIERITLPDGRIDWRVRLGNIYMVEP